MAASNLPCPLPGPAPVRKAMKKAKPMKAMKAKAKAKPMKQAMKAMKVREATLTKKQPKKQPKQRNARKSREGQVVGGTPMPKWADHCVTLLADGFFGFRGKTGNASEVQLSIWADCGGMGTEMSALSQLSESVLQLTNQKLTVSNFCFCDKNQQCLQFAKVTHQPTHTSADIFDRDFEQNSFHCTTCEAHHQFPPKIDIYVCCFPCGPWSMSGARMGFSDRDGKIVWQAAKTINKLMPGMWYMENVMGLSCSKTSADHLTASDSDLKVITDALAKQMPLYNIMCLQNIDPTHMGFPIHRNRVVITGVKKDLAEYESMARTFQVLMSHPMPVCADWMAFLGRASLLDLSPVGSSGDSAKGTCECTCSVDPYQFCALHPCHCRMCSTDGKQSRMCDWRKTHTKYIEKHIPQVDSWIANTCKLMTYLC